MRIGQMVFDLLEKQNKSQADLAKYLEIGFSTVHGWRQENRNLSSDLIMPICEFFNITPEFLLTGQDPLLKDLAPDESELVSLYRKLEPAKQLEYRAEMKGYIKAKEEDK